MRIIPELVPRRLVKEVTYDEGLLDLEFRTDDMEREQIDFFWSNLFYSLIDDKGRTDLAKEDIEILDYKLIPVDYDLGSQTVTVFIQSFLDDPKRSEALVGPITYARVGINGDLVTERGFQNKYSAAMKPHVSQLLAATALAYKPLETESLE